MRLRWRLAVVLFASSCVHAAIAACGGDDGTSHSGEGSGSEGGISDDSGILGDGGILSDGGEAGRAAACAAYVSAQCNKRVACGYMTTLDRCLDFIDLCPDFYFSPGSTRTVDGLFECADAVKAMSCADFESNAPLPACGPGTRKGGEGCKYPSQCESNACSARLETVTCGTCLSLVQGDASCNAASTVCEQGKYCDSTTHICTPTVPPQGSCTSSEMCAPLLRCMTTDGDAGGPGTCQLLPPPIGSPCVQQIGRPGTWSCESGAYCKFADGQKSGGTCTPMPSIGEACGAPPQQYYQVLCKDGYCPLPFDFTTSKCVAFRQENQSCDPSNQCDPKTSYCENGVCRRLPGVGETCQWDTTDGGVTVTHVHNCATGSCQGLPDGGGFVCFADPNPGDPGDPCSPPSVTCRTYLQCIAGKCEKIDRPTCDVARDM